MIPEQASSLARQVDVLFLVLNGISFLIIAAIVFFVVYFVLRYRSNREELEPYQPYESNLKLELSWIVMLTVLAVGVFVWAARIYFQFHEHPSGGQEVHVVAKQWMWKFQHPGGEREINELHVPVGEVVKLIMSSEDVIHSFYVPAFRLKQDVLPEHYTYAWFKATEPGEFRLYCAEYCGLNHSQMGGKVIALPPAQYAEWLAQADTSGGVQASTSSGQAASPVEQGKQLFNDLGCVNCHLADGTGPGPSLVGLVGRSVTLESGQTITADEQYIHDSILQPQKQIVKGYTPIMPSFQNQVSEEEIMALIAYIKSLGS